MARHVAFLRSLNVGGRTATKDQLISAFESIGLQNVTTFIASGNVIFDTEDETELEGQIGQALHAILDFEVPVFLRTAAELITVVDKQPFGEVDANIEVSFLPAAPASTAAAELEASAIAPDELRVNGREVYWLRHGPHKESHHTEAATVKILAMTPTQRNLRTLERIAHKFLR